MFLVMLGTAACSGPSPSGNPSTATGPGKSPAAATGTGTAAAIRRDVPYGAAAEQTLDVYAPSRTTAGAAPAPIIVMVHGGGWTRGDKENSAVVTGKVAHWVPAGYLFVSVNYRLVPEVDVAQQAGDIADALALVQRSASSWGADPGRIVLMGHSAGAHLAVLLAADTTLQKTHGVAPWRGTASFDSATLDVVATMRAPHLRLYDNAFGKDPAFWTATSPYQVLAAAPAPMLLVCSTRRTDPCPQARSFAARVTSFGGRAEVDPVDLSHGQINDELGLPGPLTSTVDAFLGSLG